MMSFSGLVSALRMMKEGKGGLDAVPKMFWQPNTWGVDFLLELTRFHWSAISFMPTEEITPEIALEAISQDSCALEFIPINLRTYEVCKKAVEKNLSALNYTPDEFIHDFLSLSLEKIEYDSDKWSEIPGHFKTYEFTLEAIRANPFVIEYVPTKMQTQEMCEAFISGSCDNFLEDVKVEARSRALCIACLQVGRGPIDAVPRLLWGPDIIEANRIGQLLYGDLDD
jgi:hypothetical protein